MCYILKGKLIVRYDNRRGKLEKKILSKGDAFRFPPKIVDQEQALTDVEVIEA